MDLIFHKPKVDGHASVAVDSGSEWKTGTEACPTIEPELSSPDLTHSNSSANIFENRSTCGTKKKVPSRPSLSRSAKASALVVVMWVVIILSFAVAVSSERVVLILQDSGIRARRLEASLLADSAFARLDKTLQTEFKQAEEAQNPGESKKNLLDFSNFRGRWKSPHEEVDLGVEGMGRSGKFWIEIVDENSKINWLKTSHEVWETLLSKFGNLSDQQIDEWFDALEDWQDGDDLRKLNGAENADYKSMDDVARRAKDSPITDPGELFWIRGGSEMMNLMIEVDSLGNRVPLSSLATIYGDGKINFNTAPAVLIAASEDRELAVAEEFVSTRDQNLEADESTAEGNTTSTAFAPSIFRVRGIGEYMGQRVIREALARSSGESMVLLQEPRTVIEEMIEKN
jgi:type II secretory pathway component PulK